MNEKILLVDDREDNLMSLEAILAPDGYRFVKARSGTETLKVLLNQLDFAMILMDVKMPNLNGFETAKLIYEREKLRHIPIIFITANNYGEENIFKGYKAGAVDYVYKPVNPDLLRAKVSVFIDLYRKNHKLIAQEQHLIAINRSLEEEIRERKSSEEKIRDLNKKLIENITQLEIANRDLDQFAFMASHDLQEPLRKIRMFSNYLYSKYSDILEEKGKDFIDRIQVAAERMQALIKDMLTFSRVSVDESVFVKTDLNGLVKEVLEEMNETLKSKNAIVDVGPLPSLYVNPVLMRPLFFNLISNAIKYSKKDVPPVIRIQSDPNSKGINSSENNGYCRIYIEDNGIGFEQKYSEQIFQMFKRLHLHSEFEGTGIGLALCKKIVEKHNGFITAQGKVSKGATFIISLPIAPPSVKTGNSLHEPYGMQKSIN